MNKTKINYTNVKHKYIKQPMKYKLQTNYNQPDGSQKEINKIVAKNLNAN